MALPSDQQIIQLKTSTSRVRTWKKKVKKVFQLRELITGWKEIEYLPGKEAIEVLIRMFEIVQCKRRMYKLLNAKGKCTRSTRK